MFCLFLIKVLHVRMNFMNRLFNIKLNRFVKRLLWVTSNTSKTHYVRYGYKPEVV